MPQRSAIFYILPARFLRESDSFSQPVKTVRPLIGRPSNCSAYVFAAGLLIALALWPSPVQAQPITGPHIQAGVGVFPGIGLEAGYVATRSFYTVEGALYVDGSPRFAGGEGSVQVAGGLGGAIRILGIMRLLGSPSYVGRDFDFGLRFGPSLFFAVGESSRGENPFSLFLEPFFRATSNFGGDRLYFAELGIQRPFLRAGVWFSL